MPALPTFPAPGLQQPLDVGGMFLDAFQGAQDRVRKQGAQDQEMQMRQQEFGNQQEQNQYNISQRPTQEALTRANLAASEAHAAIYQADAGTMQMNMTAAKTAAATKLGVIAQIDSLGAGGGAIPVTPMAGSDDPHDSIRSTSYGYANDKTPDSNSAAGIGAFVSDEEAARIKSGENTPNKLAPGDMAVSKDMRRSLAAAGVKPGQTFTVHYADGTTHTGRYMDHTADSITSDDGTTKNIVGRFDVYSPDGLDANDGKHVVAVSKGKPGEALPPALPTLAQLDQLQKIGSLYPNDKDIQARIGQIELINSIRPDIINQRNARDWSKGALQFSQGQASLSHDLAAAAAVARIAGIGTTTDPETGAMVVNQGSLPTPDNPQAWEGMLKKQQDAIAQYNANPAQFMATQGGQLKRQPLDPGFIAGHEAMLRVATNVNTDPAKATELMARWQANQDIIEARNRPPQNPTDAAAAAAKTKIEKEAADELARKQQDASTQPWKPGDPITHQMIAAASPEGRAQASSASILNQEWTDSKNHIESLTNSKLANFSPQATTEAIAASQSGSTTKDQDFYLEWLDLARKIATNESMSTGQKVAAAPYKGGAPEHEEQIPAQQLWAKKLGIKDSYKIGGVEVPGETVLKAWAEDVLTKAGTVEKTPRAKTDVAPSIKPGQTVTTAGGIKITAKE